MSTPKETPGVWKACAVRTPPLIPTAGAAPSIESSRLLELSTMYVTREPVEVSAELTLGTSRDSIASSFGRNALALAVFGERPVEPGSKLRSHCMIGPSRGVNQRGEPGESNLNPDNGL